MAEQGVIAAVRSQACIVPEQGGELLIPKGFLTPGFIATATCLGCAHQVTGLQYADPNKHKDLFEAMRVPYLLTGLDSYTRRRTNQGINYSPVQMLDNTVDFDKAASEICNCIRQHVEDLPGIGKLCDVIGELHDNVRAHAEGVGFSMSLNWSSMGKEPVIEFAIADAGQGFLRECRRTAVLGVTNDKEAICWCLASRNSTKDIDYEEFSQQQPEDAMGNPYGSGPQTRPRHDGNHH
nr:hypothetical protein [uncultured Halomonas sp.]